MTPKIKSLSLTKKIIFGAAGIFTLFGIIGAVSPSPKTDKTVNIQTSAAVKGESDTDPTKTVPKPEVETKKVAVAADIPFQSTTQNDATLASGKTAIVMAGVIGKKTLTYDVTYADGLETARKLVSEKVTLAPVNEIKKLGTRVVMQAPPPPPAPAATPAPAANCDTNYAGACVPIANDVDCAGGSGNGPAYVQGPVRVVGSDIYGLDADHDGYGCE